MPMQTRKATLRDHVHGTIRQDPGLRHTLPTIVQKKRFGVGETSMTPLTSHPAPPQPRPLQNNVSGGVTFSP